MSNQRQIKFRVWDKTLKKMFTPTNRIIGPSIIKEDGNFYWSLLTENEVIQQFTGLQDIKGKDIYEGDIIKVSELGANQNAGPGKRQISRTFEKAIVTWDNNMLAYTYNPIRKVGANIPHQLLRYGYEPKIIGNIFENPELLEK